MTKQSISRRDFLKLSLDGLGALGGLLGLAGLIRFLSYKTDPPKPTQFDLGPADNYKMGSRTTFPEIPAVLIRSDTGFKALSLVCTHLGCTVGVQQDGFACPCHGSLYNPDGVPTKGPAYLPLKVLRLEQTSAGNLILHLN
jgi:cytochrome b6-f complex iron-sulfur subunit